MMRIPTDFQRQFDLLLTESHKRFMMGMPTRMRCSTFGIAVLMPISFDNRGPDRS